MTIEEKIAEKPGKFFKALFVYVMDEAVFTRTHYLIPRNVYSDLCEEFGDKNFNMLSELVAITRCLQEKYGYSSDANTVVGLYNEYQERYWKAFHKNMSVHKFQLHPVEAFKEMVARGFIPLKLASQTYTKKDMYLKADHFGLIYPIKILDHNELPILQRKIGVRGYTGYNQPI